MMLTVLYKYFSMICGIILRDNLNVTEFSFTNIIYTFIRELSFLPGCMGVSLRSENPKFEFRCTHPRTNWDHNNAFP